MKTANKIYAIYKGDELLVVGNVYECCEYMGWNLNTLYARLCKSYKKLYKTSVYEIIEVEDD